MADIKYTGLSAEHISTNLANYEAARSGFFNFIIGPKINELVKYTYTGDRAEATDADKLGSLAQETIKLNVTSASVPHFSLETLEYVRGNERIRFAGVPTFSAGSIAVDDVVGLDTKTILMSWLGAAYNVHTRKGGRMKDYKIDCQLVEYTQDFEPIRTWDLYGCWVSEISEDSFDKESDGKRKMTATIQYDRAVMSLPEEENA